MANKSKELDLNRALAHPAKCRAIAETIANRLFTNGSGGKASRLQLRGPQEQDFGGWCEDAAIKQIIPILEREIDL